MNTVLLRDYGNSSSDTKPSDTQHLAWGLTCVPQVRMETAEARPFLQTISGSPSMTIGSVCIMEVIQSYQSALTEKLYFVQATAKLNCQFVH